MSKYDKSRKESIFVDFPFNRVPNTSRFLKRPKSETLSSPSCWSRPLWFHFCAWGSWTFWMKVNPWSTAARGKPEGSRRGWSKEASAERAMAASRRFTFGRAVLLLLPGVSSFLMMMSSLLSRFSCSSFISSLWIFCRFISRDNS